MLAAIMDAQAGQCPEERQEAQAGREDRAEGKGVGSRRILFLIFPEVVHFPF